MQSHLQPGRRSPWCHCYRDRVFCDTLAINELPLSLAIVALVTGVLDSAVASAPPSALPLSPLLPARLGRARTGAVALAAIAAPAQREFGSAATAVLDAQLHPAAARPTGLYFLG
jgi:hypothetical protein